MIRITGKEFIKYWNDCSVWKDGYWFEEDSFRIDGIEVEVNIDSIRDTSVINITGGRLYRNENDEFPMSWERHIKLWRKSQAMKTLLVEIPREKEQEFNDFMKTIKGVVSAN